MSLFFARRALLSKKKIKNYPALTYFCCTKTTKAENNNYEYIQRSKVPTMHFQSSLPRLPIPKLEDTCRRYLNALKPLLNDDELKKTQAIVEKFQKNEGANLQKELQDLDSFNKHTSYISKPWFDMYLKDRKPLPVNYNPFLIFTPESDEQYNKQLVKATNLVVSSMRFFKSLRDNILEPEVFHLNPKKSDTNFFRTFTSFLPSSVSWYGAYLLNAYPLDMSQYKNLFNSTRIPEFEQDRIEMNENAKHIIVMRNGYFYAFDVMNDEKKISSPNQIATNLQYILQDNRPPANNPIGILTTTERNYWSNTRKYLESINNNEILKKIDSAVFLLILDDEPVGTDKVKLLRRYLHGGAENRWFDKSFSMIVTKDGFAGLNFEHSWGDGVAILRYFQDIKKDINEKPQFHPVDEKNLSVESSSVEPLNFNVDCITKQIISKAQNDYDKWTDNLDVGYLMYEGFGKKDCKNFGISPDAVMQLVFQLALFKQESKSVATYESCSTAAFKHGRTETLRPCTLQTKNFCETMTAKNKSGVSLQQLKKMIIDCSKAHTTLTKEAAMGQGFDRHLFALKKLAEKSNKTVSIFQDSSYNLINHNILSTSTLSSPVVLAGGFGPVVNDGYGIGYMIQEKKLGVVVTSYRDKKSATKFIGSLEESFKDIHKVLLSN